MLYSLFTHVHVKREELAAITFDMTWLRQEAKYSNDPRCLQHIPSTSIHKVAGKKLRLSHIRILN